MTSARLRREPEIEMHFHLGRNSFKKKRKQKHILSFFTLRRVTLLTVQN